MPVSHHSHSGQFCRHAQGTLEEMIQAAISCGFATYSLTEHVPRSRQEDLYPEEADITPADLTSTFLLFLKESRRLQHKYDGDIRILVGCETELIHPTTSFSILDSLLPSRASDIDFLVGSVHHVLELPIDFDVKTFEKVMAKCVDAPAPSEAVVALPPLARLFCAYFDAQYELLLRYPVDIRIVGHFDLCRLYHPEVRLDEHPEVWSRVERNVKLGVEMGALFEVNTAAVRKGWKTPYPGPEVLKLILSHNGRLTLSDDAHSPSQVGQHYLAARQYLLEHHVKSVWYLEKALTDSGEITIKAKELMGWEEGRFWESKREPGN